MQIFDQKVLRRIASRIGDAGRDRIAMERVFEVVVVLGDVLRDYIGGGAGSDHHGLEAAGPRFQRENDLADIAGITALM